MYLLSKFSSNRITAKTGCAIPKIVPFVSTILMYEKRIRPSCNFRVDFGNYSVISKSRQGISGFSSENSSSCTLKLTLCFIFMLLLGAIFFCLSVFTSPSRSGEITMFSFRDFAGSTPSSVLHHKNICQ